MSYETKAIKIQLILIVVSLIITFILGQLLDSKGLHYMTQFCPFIPTTTFGIYILFGKYIYLRGIVITRLNRIVFGLLFLLIAPTIWFIRS